ncbi:MAG: hypothetical protein KDA32_04185 [Phycisphaerales bacterium]|nr:hypothetical protein [Phycisphaerales bacterium]
MKRMMTALAVISACAATSVAFGQTTTPTNLFSNLGVLGPILFIAWFIFFATNGGFKLIFPT